MSSRAAEQHRTSLTLFVAFAAVAVIAVLLLARTRVEQFVGRLPDVAVSSTSVAIAVAALATLTGTVLVMLHAARAVAGHARTRALETLARDGVHGGIRSADLVAALDELADGRERASLGARFSVVADDIGLSLWSGGRRPRRAALFAWREIRTIRADSTVIGTAVVPLVVVRVRRSGASVELPIVLSDDRPGRYALADAPFYAVVRGWKAKHRAALAAEGLELPPLTAPIPVIRAA